MQTEIPTILISPWLWLIAAYLVGSIATAIIVSRLLRLPDPRTIGSSNPGATNVFRYGGKLGGLLTFIGDALKGFIPVLLAQQLTESPIIVSAAFFGAILGHLFPIFFRFRGGKGVATMVGGLAALDLWLGLIFISIWVFIAILSRYSSLASILSAIAMPIAAFWIYSPLYAPPLCLFSLLLVARHHENIRRLLNGEESRLNISRLKGEGR